jgi:hypothetical protein
VTHRFKINTPRSSTGAHGGMYGGARGSTQGPVWGVTGGYTRPRTGGYATHRTGGYARPRAGANGGGVRPVPNGGGTRHRTGGLHPGARGPVRGGTPGQDRADEIQVCRPSTKQNSAIKTQQQSLSYDQYMSTERGREAGHKWSLARPSNVSTQADGVAPTRGNLTWNRLQGPRSSNLRSPPSPRETKAPRQGGGRETPPTASPPG